jgi:hypothetical protein
MAWLRAVLVTSIALFASLAADAQQDSPGTVSTPAENCSILAPENCTLLVG